MSPATIPAPVARRLFPWCLAATLLLTLLLAAQAQAAPPAPPAGFANKTAQVNGTTIHYRIGGKGSPVVLLHGYTQTGHMWTPVMAQLAKSHTVIVPDLRGTGASAKAPGGYEKANMAEGIHALV